MVLFSHHYVAYPHNRLHHLEFFIQDCFAAQSFCAVVGWKKGIKLTFPQNCASLFYLETFALLCHIDIDLWISSFWWSQQQWACTHVVIFDVELVSKYTCVWSLAMMLKRFCNIWAGLTVMRMKWEFLVAGKFQQASAIRFLELNSFFSRASYCFKKVREAG